MTHTDLIARLRQVGEYEPVGHDAWEAADALTAAQERVEVLEMVVRNLVAWWDAEDNGPDYGSLTRDTHPFGEAIWREWWDRNLKLCDTTHRLARAALAKGG